jgi:hypothetical protein
MILQLMQKDDGYLEQNVALVYTATDGGRHAQCVTLLYWLGTGAQ